MIGAAETSLIVFASSIGDTRHGLRGVMFWPCQMKTRLSVDNENDLVGADAIEAARTSWEESQGVRSDLTLGMGTLLQNSDTTILNPLR